ncbi:Ig-like domain-containing protein [Mycolicibacterium mucogenicum]|uniref:Ig-like domain-containing protein n=1 Tax=Mycolicibacterium mucogenicum DSM 44124 TaxID=1226753 RepID=A0A8H2PJB4_MYCMU|nr:Ig-like domain-containing protein [Mycolicibacterium mucogenicum]KAB7752767.1 hypothetical protein MMUC44124_26460 [Mycolicibacterium mucogenicum DSM 44124]QPG69086.1 Ig-like domain-containing protein [Mycolicibacterium mucogenicum DSM 44124]
MALTDRQRALTKRKNLLLAARQFSVIQYSYSAPLITSIHDEATGALVLPVGGFPIGLHKKSEGGNLSNDQTINDTESHGVGGPTRQIPTKRVIQLGLSPQETSKANLENYWGTDWSDVELDAGGGFTASVSDLPQNRLARAVLYGEDDFDGLYIGMGWIGNRVNIAKTDAQKIVDAEVLMYPWTMNFQTEDALETPLTLDIFGPGWKRINELVDGGFTPVPTGITAAPATPALTVTAGAGHTQQLTVTDNNGIDRTAASTFISSAPAKATVSAGGLITGVAAGTANVTATYVTVNGDILTSVSAVTVS